MTTASITPKEEITLSAEVTITFLLENVCYKSDLDEDDFENHFEELVEEQIQQGDYVIDFEAEQYPAFISSIKMVS